MLQSTLVPNGTSIGLQYHLDTPGHGPSELLKQFERKFLPLSFDCQNESLSSGGIDKLESGFHDWPDILNWIQIRRIAGPIQDNDTIFLTNNQTIISSRKNDSSF